MSSSNPQSLSVLPPDLEAKRLIIQKKFLILFLIAMIPIVFGILHLLFWLVGLKVNMIACVGAELLFAYACSYGVLFILEKYLQGQCTKIGYVCPHCHAPLFKALMKKDKVVEVTGRCPSCNELVTSNITAESLQGSKTELKKRMSLQRQLSLSACLLIIVGQGMHYYADHSTPESVAADLIQKKQYDQAITELDKDISANPRDVHALAMRGEVYSIKGMNERALQDYNQALAINPNYYPALNDRCRAEIMSAKDDDAITDCTNAIKLNPSIWQHFSNRCWAYVDNEQYDLAIPDCTKAIALNPDTFVSFLMRGAAYASKYQYDLAEKDMSEAIRLNPDSGALFAARGAVYMTDGHFDLAQQDYDKAAALDPKSSGLFLGRGILRALQQSYPAAIDDLESAVKENPDEPYGPIWLHISKRHLGQGDQAELKQSSSAIKKDKWPRSIVELYAGTVSLDAVQAQAKIGDPSTQAEQACEMGYYVGEYYLEHNDRNNAKAFLLSAIKSCPSFNFEEKQAAIAEFKAQNF